MLIRTILAVVALALVSACGSSLTVPTPSPNTLQLTGTVRTGGLPIVGANVKILDGANQNKNAATDAGGRYTLTALVASGFTLEVTATGYTTVTKGVTLTVSASADVDLTPALRAFLIQEGSADGVLQPDGSYAFTLGMTNTGDGCAGGISGVTTLTNAARAVLTVLNWTALPTVVVRPAGHATYTVSGVNAADAFAASQYATTFSYATVSCP
jgi:hypothetical protein